MVNAVQKFEWLTLACVLVQPGFVLSVAAAPENQQFAYAKTKAHTSSTKLVSAFVFAIGIVQPSS